MSNIKDILSPMGAEVSIIPVMQGDGTMKVNETELPDSMPILALRNAVLFPGTVYPITIGREKSIRLIQDAEKNNTYIGAVPQLDVTVEDPKKEDLYTYGTVARIIKTLEMPDGTLTAILQGFRRFEIEDIVEYDPYMLGRVHYLHDIVPEENDNNIRMIIESLKEKATTILKFSSFAPKEASMALRSIDSFEFLVNFIATTIEVENFFEKVQLLQYTELKTRAMKLLAVLDTQIELLKIKQDINQKVKSEIDQQQREYYLNNQLRTIQEELGMDDTEDFDRFRKKAEEKIWPASVQEIFEKEMANARPSVGRDVAGQPRHEERPESPQRGPLRAGYRQGQDYRISCRTEAERRHEVTDPLSIRPSGSRKDEPRQIDRPCSRTEIRQDLTRRHA